MSRTEREQAVVAQVSGQAAVQPSQGDRGFAAPPAGSVIVVGEPPVNCLVADQHGDLWRWEQDVKRWACVDFQDAEDPLQCAWDELLGTYGPLQVYVPVAVVDASDAGQ